MRCMAGASPVLFPEQSAPLDQASAERSEAVVLSHTQRGKFPAAGLVNPETGCTIEGRRGQRPWQGKRAFTRPRSGRRRNDKEATPKGDVCSHEQGAITRLDCPVRTIGRKGCPEFDLGLASSLALRYCCF